MVLSIRVFLIFIINIIILAIFMILLIFFYIIWVFRLIFNFFFWFIFPNFFLLIFFSRLPTHFASLTVLLLIRILLLTNLWITLEIFLVFNHWAFFWWNRHFSLFFVLYKTVISFTKFWIWLLVLQINIIIFLLKILVFM